MRDRNRAARGQRVDDRVVRRRNHQRLHRPADRYVGGEDARVAGLDHLRDHHRADRRGVGHRRSRDAAEQRAGKDVHQRQSAADEADEDPGEVDQARRHAALGHDAAGQHEERNRQQREVVGAVGDLQHHRFERDVDPERGDDRRQAERVGDRHAEARTGRRTNPAVRECPLLLELGRLVAVHDRRRRRAHRPKRARSGTAASATRRWGSAGRRMPPKAKGTRPSSGTG